MFSMISPTLNSTTIIDTFSAVLPAMATAAFQLCGFQPWDLLYQEDYCGEQKSLHVSLNKVNSLLLRQHLCLPVTYQ